MNSPVVYLIPNTLGEEVSVDISFPTHNREAISSIEVFAVEHIKEARRLFVKLGLKHKIEQSRFYEIHNKSNPLEQRDLLQELDDGNAVGVISDAGCPSIADPGSGIVAHAHRKNYEVIPLVGPSSIFLALMASGFNGQSFAFHGYLDRDPMQKQKQLRLMEKTALQIRQTQIFMETPYRNESMMKSIVDSLQGSTLCCVASAIQHDNAFIRTKSIAEWKKGMPSIQKQPAIFLLSA